MKALVFHNPKDVRVETVEDPKVKASDDAIIRVTSTAICGSDLHIYNGMFPQPRNMILGHEFMGIVEDVGPGVSKLKKGDRVVVPFPIACGHCKFCSMELPTHCENSNPEHYGPEGGLLKGKGGALFGYTDLYGGYDGGQAEYVRVPYANVGPRKVPEGLTDEQILFMTDIFPTGWSAIDWAELKGGETVVVFGCGPVGIMAQKSAWIKGAGRVIGVDIQPYRLEMAKKAAKVETINASEVDVVDAIRSMTGGYGADVCVDAVGLEAERSILEKAMNVIQVEKGTMKVLEKCMDAVRRGGVVTVVGVYGTTFDNFPLHQFFDKGIKLMGGQAWVHRYIDQLISLVVEGKVVLDDIITHKVSLSEAPKMYDIFNKKQDNCVKVVLKP
ncbi:zinc-dependent alcohol dehydrogenase [Cytophagaceae bacterium DM2B3-1]|uniref:Zinc-dependent alcohol dehydrogenase n=1 Tax=Xanthocytophaga flava TaxID=3048013 RepID=A0ABT7CZG6_9BACT|nr:zinc-dependent alcohol dehydrogenase [Xanthocytophaga flavus]MDJ1472614.1 zinc-dependent alcohol dehydrogenase [Xanthocytophaga flavus]MDJ1497964.1 zinc-dependent alcohol dehydrogenase [Xanthocytophaga flavus]